MVSDTNRVVVVGAGYGGLHVAQKLGGFLRRQRSELVLIDQNSYHLIETKIHEVAAASVEPSRIAIPFGDLVDEATVHFRQAVVTGFDYGRRVVLTSSGDVAYRTLVIALGSETDYFGIPGMAQFSLGLKTLEEAVMLREHIRDCFSAALKERDPGSRCSLLTIVIGGGGFTGTELAAELADWLVDLRKEFGIGRDETRLVVLEGSPSILTGFDPQLIQRATKVLTEKGVELHLSSIAAAAGPTWVRLKSGETFSTNTLVWTGGVRAGSLVATSGLSTGAKGRIVVNPYLESVEYPDVYLVGDNALVLDRAGNRPVAPSAQVALQEATAVVGNIRAQRRGEARKPFVPNLRGEFVSLGRRYGVGIVKGIRVTGRLALMLKRANEMRYLAIIGGPWLVARYLMHRAGAPPEELTHAAEESEEATARRRRIAK